MLVFVKLFAELLPVSLTGVDGSVSVFAARIRSDTPVSSVYIVLELISIHRLFAWLKRTPVASVTDKYDTA